MPIEVLNKWQILHNFQKPVNRRKFRLEIMEECGWSKATFYLKFQAPEKLSKAEMRAICAIYNVPMEMVFPETKTKKQPVPAL